MSDMFQQNICKFDLYNIFKFVTSYHLNGKRMFTKNWQEYFDKASWYIFLPTCTFFLLLLKYIYFENFFIFH